MPHINTSASAPGTRAASSGRAEAGPSTARPRSSARHAAPEGLPAAARRPVGPQDAQPTRMRIALDTLQLTAQTVVNSGARMAHTGARMGAAAGHAMMANPLKTMGVAGMGMMAAGAAQALVQLQHNDGTAPASDVPLAGVGFSLLLATQAADLIRQGAEGLRPSMQTPEAAEAAVPASRPPQVDAELLSQAINHVVTFGEPDPDDPDDMSAEVGNRTHQVIDHLLDLRADTAHPDVAAAVAAANGDSAQLVRNILALINADPPVLSSRPNSVALRPADRPAPQDPA
ncbi:hypothetical protein AX018_100534 [Paracidovorax anthurii]|uniref:Uncharacterized protein n=1 Tax=Paracidovorax anthurii TaxID=78229 RepID=A0A328ZT01_9BURK|nr:hypothetical protein [Paracidovorax anthurii]RAR85406.1 hypothetical protein AX018_100534 [Paracidovorax anthurii]